MKQKRSRDAVGAGLPLAQSFVGWSLPRLLGTTYGLLSKKAANPKWPEFLITAFVLKKYRGKSSYWFMIKNAARGMALSRFNASRQNAEGLYQEAQIREILAHLIGSRPRDLHRLSGIYKALLLEKGATVASAAIAEIITTTNQRRTKKYGLIRKTPTPIKKLKAKPQKIKFSKKEALVKARKKSDSKK
ncbi:MAG: hypothetical protein LDLANPLL_01766 [Turneriella sp.]|nr:hypothetical protein [Turneriella sp.]